MSEMNEVSGGLSPEPKKSNTTLIIVIVAVVLLCCCCITAVVGWQYGDALVQSLG